MTTPGPFPISQSDYDYDGIFTQNHPQTTDDDIIMQSLLTQKKKNTKGSESSQSEEASSCDRCEEMTQGKNDRLLSHDYREPYKLHIALFSLERLVGWLVGWLPANRKVKRMTQDIKPSGWKIPWGHDIYICVFVYIYIYLFI